jgi:hypothetical protein
MWAMDNKQNASEQQNIQNNNQYFSQPIPQNIASEPTSASAEWPGAFGIFKTSQKAIGLNAWLLIGLFILSAVISNILANISKLFGDTAAISVASSLSGLASFVASCIFSFMMIYVVIESVRGNKTSLNSAIEAVTSDTNRLLHFFLAQILVSAISFASIIVFIIPAFFIIPRVSLTFYFLIDKKMDAIEALSASWNYTKGNVGKVYGIFGVSVLIGLTAVLLITIPLTIYLLVSYMAAYALLYMYIVKKKNL